MADGSFVVRPAHDVTDGEARSEAGKAAAWMWMRTSALRMVDAIPGCGEQLGVTSMAVDEQLLRRGRAARLHRGDRFRQLADASGDGVDRHGDVAGVTVVQQRRAWRQRLSEAERCEMGYGGAVEGVGEGKALAEGFIAQRLGLRGGVPTSVPLI